MVAKKTAVQQSAPSGRPGTVAGGGSTTSGREKGTPPTSARSGGSEHPVAVPKGPAVAAGETVEKATAEKSAPKEMPAFAVPEPSPSGREAVHEETSARAAVRDAASVREEPAGKAAGGKRTAARERAAAGREGSGGERGGAAGISGSTQNAAGHSAADEADAAEAAAQTGVTTVGAKKTPGPVAATAVPKARIGAVDPGDLAVRPGEEPWTAEEVEEARAELISEVLRLREEISSSEQSLAGLMRDSNDGAGDDDADTGSKNITREHELALAANAREMLHQSERALQRLDAGTYGLCESCGNPIGKARMLVFPRATLCVECKQKQERRY